MPMNILKAQTEMDEEPETILQRSKETAETEAQLIATIAETYAATGQDQESLPQTAQDITPSFLGVPGSIPKLAFDPTDSTFEPYRIVCESPQLENELQQVVTQVQFPSRFVTSVTALNSLVYQTLLDEGNSDNPNPTANATGTMESILQWAANDKLDANQQTAFEILAATYVLTFHEDATGTEELLQTAKLKKMARRKVNCSRKLCMFLTGPAGAGKCKYRFSKCSPKSVENAKSNKT